LDRDAWCGFADLPEQRDERGRFERRDERSETESATYKRGATEHRPMTDTERLWLVERTYTDRDLVVLVYATPEGDRRLRKELASSMLERTTVTAAVEADPADLGSVDDPETRERYADEVERVRSDHEPDDPI
jgi:hypothetical protein